MVASLIPCFNINAQYLLGPIEQAVQMFADLGIGRGTLGPKPERSVARASPELLVQLGLSPDGQKLETQPA